MDKISDVNLLVIDPAFGKNSGVGYAVFKVRQKYDDSKKGNVSSISDELIVFGEFKPYYSQKTRRIEEILRMVSELINAHNINHVVIEGVRPYLRRDRQISSVAYLGRTIGAIEAYCIICNITVDASISSEIWKGGSSKSDSAYLVKMLYRDKKIDEKKPNAIDAIGLGVFYIDKLKMLCRAESCILNNILKKVDEYIGKDGSYYFEMNEPVKNKIDSLEREKEVKRDAENKSKKAHRNSKNSKKNA